MKSFRLTVLALCILLAGCAEKSQQPRETQQEAHDLSPAESGRARAKTDIANGTLQILYYGKPWGVDKPLVDDASGLPVQIAEGCVVMPDFRVKIDAYNEVMRTAAKSKQIKKE